MSISALHTLYAVNLNTETLAGSPVLFDQVQNFGISTGLQRILARGDGDVDPTYVAIMSSRPQASFGTTAVATALAACGIGGAVIDNGTYPGLEMWFQKMAEGGTRASGSNHLKMTGAEGLLVPLTLSAAQDGIATVNYRAMFTYDGTHDPVVTATSQALSGSPSVGEMFTVGPASLNGSTVEGVQNLSINFGIQEILAAGDGDVWATYIAIMLREPSFTLTTTDPTVLDTFGIVGTAISASDVVLYLRKLAEGGTRVADDGGEHVSFTLDEGLITCVDLGANQDGLAQATLRVDPTYDGSNAIIVISTTANLP